jgi:hypothetical protein
MPDGYEVPGPGADAPGPAQISTVAARTWAIAAAQAAIQVPALSAEADAWTVRGWADAAVGCLALDLAAGLDGPGAFSGLDEVIRAERVRSGGEHADRLRRLRRFIGPVPWWYPDAGPLPDGIRPVRPVVWQAAGLVADFGALLMSAAGRLAQEPPCSLSSARQLAWGRPFRPSPSQAHLTLQLPITRRLARRTWMCLPGIPDPATAIAEVPSAAAPIAQQVWRGIHEGAHLDYLAALALSRPGVPPAPSPAEFGTGLLAAEAYAMAVEFLAAVECLLTGEAHAACQLGAGLIERAARLPGGSAPTSEFADLPTLAEVYLLGPLYLLTTPQPNLPSSPTHPATMPPSLLPGNSRPGDAVPELLTAPLRARWLAVCAAYPPAAAFTDAAAQLLGRAGSFP